MALTVASKIHDHAGVKRSTQATITFDAAYPIGGESLTAGNMGLSSLERMEIMPVEGYGFEYDYTNEMIKVFEYKSAPPIVYDEQHTIAAHAITLTYPAAAIINIAGAAQSQMLIEPSDTMTTSECQLSAAMSEGVCPTINFHASTSGVIKVTYITQAFVDVWDNRVASGAFATTSEVADLDDTICFIESCVAYDATGDVKTSLNKFVMSGDTPTTGECEVDWSDSGTTPAGDTTLTFAAADAVANILLTYVSLPASGFLKDRFLEIEDVTIGSNVGTSKYPILFPAFCNQLPDFDASAEEDTHYLQMPEGDAIGAVGEWRIDWHLLATLAGNQIAIENSTSDAVALTYVYGLASELPGNLKSECVSGTDLSSLTIKVNAVGR